MNTHFMFSTYFAHRMELRIHKETQFLYCVFLPVERLYRMTSRMVQKCLSLYVSPNFFSCIQRYLKVQKKDGSFKAAGFNSHSWILCHL